MEETILTVDQVAQIIQVHPFTVLKFIKQGKLKAAKLGRVYRIRRSDVDAFLDSQVQPSATGPKNSDQGSGKQAEPAPAKKSKSTRSSAKTSSKVISPDSSLTDESKEVPLKKEPANAPVEKSTVTNVPKVNDQSEAKEHGKKERKTEDHYVIDFTI